MFENIKRRFLEKGEIFTMIGAPILISINPYRRLPIFNISVAQKVRNYSLMVRGKPATDPKVKLGAEIEDPGPHLFMVAENAYQSLMQD